MANVFSAAYNLINENKKNAVQNKIFIWLTKPT